MAKEINCNTCKFHYIEYPRLDFMDKDHKCRHPQNCWTTIFDKVENQSPIYGIKKAIHHGICMECNKNNNCKHYKPNWITIIANWFVSEK
jgi:hypothetical protein